MHYATNEHKKIREKQKLQKKIMNFLARNISIYFQNNSGIT